MPPCAIRPPATPAPVSLPRARHVRAPLSILLSRPPVSRRLPLFPPWPIFPALAPASACALPLWRPSHFRLACPQAALPLFRPHRGQAAQCSTPRVARPLPRFSETRPGPHRDTLYPTLLPSP